MSEQVTRHRSIFGEVPTAAVHRLLDRHVRDHLRAGIAGVLFETGDVGAVYGVRLTDGRSVVLKAFQAGIDLDRAREVTRCQSLLFHRGFPCADVLDGPSLTNGVAIVAESVLEHASTGNPHQRGARDAMTHGLARQIRLLRDIDGSALNQGRPAWANYDHGAWPPPHDPVFDFTTPARGHAWVDERAHTLAALLREASTDLRPVIGHTDWVWQNVGVEHDRFVAGFDWDSLAFLPESVVVGLSAGAYTQGSPVPPDAPSWDQVEGFIDSYQSARGVPFNGTERDAAENAAGWVRCYNARCQLDNQQRRGMEPTPGASLEQMRDDPMHEHPQADRICDH